MAEEQGFNALAREHTSDPQAGVDDIMVSLDTEETPRDETGKFTARKTEEPESEPVDDEEATEAPAEDTEDDIAPEEASDEEDPDVEPEEAIDAPTSWTDEEKAAFAQLPPATQATIAARESTREQSINARLAETAAERNATKAEREAVQTERRQAAEFLSQVSAYARNMDPIIAKGLNTDWAALAREEGADEAMAQKAEFEQRVQYLQHVENEMGRIQHASNNQYREYHTNALHEVMPDLKDSAKFAAFKDAVLPTALEAGYTPDELDMLWKFVPGTDHRQVKILDKAAKWDKMMAERKTIALKKASPTPPKVQKPRAAQDTGTKTVSKAALRKLESNPGDIDALTRLFQN